MTDHRFDRLARLLSSAGSRRQTLAVLGALALARAHRASAASQIETAACGETGAVCTELMGCCSGLVCATSYTNPAYGVCVAGEGDMLPVSDDIVVPGAEGIEDALAQDVTDASAATAAGAPATESSLTTQSADTQARKDARRSKKSTQQTRRRANHGDTHEKKLANQTEKRTAADLQGAPHLVLRFIGDPNTKSPETLRVQNHEDVAVVISRVETIDRSGPKYSGTITIAAGETHWLYSGAGADTAANNDSQGTAWTGASNIEVCPTLRGIALTAYKSGASKTHRLTKRCPN
jgi:hypothetical protein